MQSRCIESGYGVDGQYTLAGVGGVGVGRVEGVEPEGVGLEGVGLGAVEAVGVEAVRVGGIRVGEVEGVGFYHRQLVKLNESVRTALIHPSTVFHNNAVQYGDTVKHSDAAQHQNSAKPMYRVGEALPLYHRFQLQLERFGGLFLNLFDALNPPVASICP